MSAGYASRLKEYPNKGVCGLPELSERTRVYNAKVNNLASLLKESCHTVLLTGAGISTAAGIPDFRGPKGIWTIEMKSSGQNHNKKKLSRKRKRFMKEEDEEETATSSSSDSETDTEVRSEENTSGSMNFAAAQPTFTHHAITKLIEDDVFQFCITQNVDGLHRRSGLSRNHHAVLHGCAFTEKCENCGLEHFRDVDVGGMSFQKTGNKCEACSGDLRDTLLDWEDPLPEDDYERAQIECEKADVVLCLGTSLRINPAGELPLKAKKFVIINLQQTPFDKDATIVIRERVDTVIKDVMKQLGYQNFSKMNGTQAPVEKLWKMPKQPRII